MLFLSNRFASHPSLESAPSLPSTLLIAPFGPFAWWHLYSREKKVGVAGLPVILSTAEHPTSAAAYFTRNVFKAAPVLVSDEILTKNWRYDARAVVVDSGCFNAVTGKQGMDDAWAMVNPTDDLLSPLKLSSIPNTRTLVTSTGVVEQHLPVSKILAVIGSDFKAWERATQVFMTTDTFPKLAERTDDRSFNSVSVDDDMSTHDSIHILANGAASHGKISRRGD